MFEAICSPDPSGPIGAERIMHLTFPVIVERGAPSYPLQSQSITPPARPSVTKAYPIPAKAADDAPQVRVDMTLADAEDLVERLRSLIAVVRSSRPAENAAQPTALALAGMKIGAERDAAAPRFSPAPRQAWRPAMAG
jgi:hypothetical protein